ncbi:ribosome biogenesis protein NOP53 [Callorhinchus milii]|uniref:Ribosome biogenesis protein NOP53 n=1 Tax=Callorhinchus milii TaxID=7868 RepID=V9KUJ6_CALMI|nr:ribosome biogenesis protein NOP53 [Callorhinchus milii]
MCGCGSQTDKMAAKGHTVSAPSFLSFKLQPRGPGTRRKRRNKNKKKNWSKFSDVRDVEDFLEDVRFQQRTVGGLVSEKPDKNLFFVDTGEVDVGKVDSKDEKKDLVSNKRKLKPLRIDLILQPDSKIPAPKNILAHQIPNSRKLRQKQEKEKRLGIVPRSQRLLQARVRSPAVRVRPVANNNPSREYYSLWSDTNPLDEELDGKDAWYLEQTKQKRLVRPARLNQKPSQVSAVEVIDPGGSYNPTFEAHQALLLKAHDVEVKRLKAEERIERQLNFPTLDKLPTKEMLFEELCQGLVESEEEEDEPSRKCDDETEAGPMGSAVRCEKKTERDRKREKALKTQERRLREEKQARRQRQELFRLRSIKGEVKQVELRRASSKAKRLAKRQAEAHKPRRLGKLRYEEPDIELKLSDELSDSLRKLKPEGSVLADRFKSLQKRNLIEPRQRAKFKRKYRLKYVEKRTFREVTL